MAARHISSAGEAEKHRSREMPKVESRKEEGNLRAGSREGASNEPKPRPQLGDRSGETTSDDMPEASSNRSHRRRGHRVLNPTARIPQASFQSRRSRRSMMSSCCESQDSSDRCCASVSRRLLRLRECGGLNLPSWICLRACGHGFVRRAHRCGPGVDSRRGREEEPD